MASANIRFSNVAVYNVTKFDVKLGEKFTIELVDQAGSTDWYSKADEVLAIKQNGNSATVEATEVGESKIRIFDSGDQRVMELNITVVDSIKEPAVSLGAKAGSPEVK